MNASKESPQIQMASREAALQVAWSVESIDANSFRELRLQRRFGEVDAGCKLAWISAQMSAPFVAVKHGQQPVHILSELPAAEAVSANELVGIDTQSPREIMIAIWVVAAKSKLVEGSESGDGESKNVR
ncbi:hypothetical protein GLOTRDRAFT_96368 [Gloeophyllum trabeum ATCC 11539]|uniref:Uncharacterized protein n=1 Tax=Gloeophyllum trabeum (strain ATCC 11539 / FP-39264 / Madison 617) TaxID=670483 RepID=S7RGH5_GLOTA|nr:uncharacterized protein GLOTRDRAFT_96368 [Gloeophyllum trabeum ATCC 11539]EPQ51654.1 hypothetical protein GLOTRDRAFT_96368 [Gloeophyllum trabeum ATCC 11539]